MVVGGNRICFLEVDDETHVPSLRGISCSAEIGEK